MIEDLSAAIEDFWIARQRGDFFPHAYADRLTLEDAYRIQLGLIDRRVLSGERHIGWKVGLTAKPIQEQFGFHEPVFGCLLEEKPTGHVFEAHELIFPGFETELCIRLGRGLEGSVTREGVAAAIDTIHPAFEIVETRGDFMRQMPLAIADNAQQHSVVLGAPAPLASEMALDRVSVRVWVNGEEVAAGLGSAVLGSPLNSVVWLAGKLHEFGRRLRPGDLIMTGSFVRQFPLVPGDCAVAEFSGIGSVRAAIASMR